MKKGLILTVLLITVLAFGFSQDADSWTVNNISNWIEAVNEIRNGDNDREYTLTVTGNISVPASNEATFGAATGITVMIQGNGTLATSNNGNLLNIGNGQTVIAKDLTLKGRDANSSSLVNIARGGTFRMEGKASVTGNKTGGNGGGVLVNGTFTMEGGTISGNSSSSTSGGA
jgi:hypothetical protein